MCYVRTTLSQTKQQINQNLLLEGEDMWNRILPQYLHHHITCEFINCGDYFKKTGVLTEVGKDYLVLENSNGNRLIGKIDGLVFVILGKQIS